MRISDWSSDVCSSDLILLHRGARLANALGQLALADREALDAGDDRGAIPVDDFQRAAEERRQLGVQRLLRLRLCKGLDQLLGLLDRRAPGGEPGAEETEQLRSEEHTSELQSLMRNSNSVFCLQTKKNTHQHHRQ